MERILNTAALWTDTLFRETAALIFAFLFAVGLALFLLHQTGAKFRGAWASVKSWLFASPLILLVAGLPYPYTLIFLVFIGVFSSKTFFRMVGIYHRSWFVWTTYVFIFALGALIHWRLESYFDVMPMLFLGCLSAIPLLRNSATHMIQYIALSLLCYIFFGWAFLHLGRILMFEHGIYILLYLFILVEFASAVNIAAGRLYGRTKLFQKITSRVSVEGIFTSVTLTLLLAWGMRHMLPDRSEKYWVTAALIASLWGRSGELFLSVIRRDLGIKNSGIFIIGRDDILARVDKLVFVAPMFFYAYRWLQQSVFL